MAVTKKKMFIGQYSGITAPIDTTKTWENDNKNSQMYFYDGADWVSSHLYRATFNKQGNLNNNGYFSIGDVDCDSDKRGFIEESEIKIIKANIIKEDIIAGDLKLISGGVGIDTFAITATEINTVNSSGTVKVLTATHVSLQWCGAKIKNPVANIYYRKVA